MMGVPRAQRNQMGYKVKNFVMNKIINDFKYGYLRLMQSGKVSQAGKRRCFLGAHARVCRAQYDQVANHGFYNIVVFLFGSMLLFAIPAVAANKNAVRLDRIIAVVNDSVITEQQVKKEMLVTKQQLQQMQQPLPSDTELRRKILDKLIDESLQLQVANQLKISVDKKTVEQAIADIAQKNGMTLEELRVKLQEQGISYQEYQKKLQDQMVINEVQQREIAPHVKVEEYEIDQMLKKIKKQNGKNTQYHLLDIVMETSESVSVAEKEAVKQAAVELMAQLKNGTDMQKIILDPAKQQNWHANDLGWRKINELPELFVSYVKHMQVGDVAGPIQTGNGFHIIKLAGINNAPQAKHMTAQYHVRHILIRTSVITTDDQAKIRLVNLRDALINGADFAKLAENNSQDQNSASKGGDLGWISPEAYEPTFIKAIASLKLGEVSHPFKSSYGWHLAQVLGKRQVDDGKDYQRIQAKEMVFRNKAGAAVQTWLHELRRQAYIKIIP